MVLAVAAIAVSAGTAFGVHQASAFVYRCGPIVHWSDNPLGYTQTNDGKSRSWVRSDTEIGLDGNGVKCATYNWAYGYADPGGPKLSLGSWTALDTTPDGRHLQSHAARLLAPGQKGGVSSGVLYGLVGNTYSYSGILGRSRATIIAVYDFQYCGSGATACIHHPNVCNAPDCTTAGTGVPATIPRRLSNSK